jgi:hypothetical protein
MFCSSCRCFADQPSVFYIYDSQYSRAVRVQRDVDHPRIQKVFFMRTLVRSIVAASITVACPASALLHAQAASSTATSAQGSDDESRQTAPAFATGVAAGTMRFNSGRSDAAVSATLQYSPSPWLVLTAAPGFGRSSFGRASSTGLADLPLSAGASHAMSNLEWSPAIYASIYSQLSLGDSTSAVGTGRSAVGASAALGAWPTAGLNLTVGGSHPLSANGGNGSIDLESAYSLGKATPSIGLSSEVGRADSGATLARSVAAGVAFALAGPLTLTIDGSRGLSAGAPTWTFSLGLGTAYAGLSPLSPSSPLRRLKGVLGSRVGATSGYVKGGTGSRGCKSAGTC